MRLFTIFGVFAVLILGIPTADAQPSKSTQDNAALKYYQAFALLPKMDDERVKILGDRENAIFNASAVKLIDESASALKLLHHGAKITHCDWGTAMDGPNTLLPHVSKVRELGNIALLRARYAFEQGKFRAGLDDVSFVLTMARHTGSENFLISLLVQIAIEHQALDVTARFLPKFDKEVLAYLGKRLDALPPGGTPGASILMEREHMVKWQIRQIQDQMYGADKAIEAIVRAAGGPKGPVKQLEELAARYEELAQIASLPRDQFDVKWAAFGKSLEGNTFAKLLLPALEKVHDADTRSKVRWAMFTAARAIQDGGTQQLQSVRDPAGTGPFEYKELPDGFALKSKMIYKDQPVVLVVGSSKP